ncbi:MAG: hypothetical protein GY906_07935 [bacterium]|nr:hypothetical protein [bacterium]
MHDRQPNPQYRRCGCNGYTFYGRYSATSSQIMGREPLATNWDARYLRGSQGSATVDLLITQGLGGPTICEFSSIPNNNNFSFDCDMTAGEVASLDAGDVFAEEIVNLLSTITRVNPVDIFVFAGNFESGGTYFWSQTQP